MRSVIWLTMRPDRWLTQLRVQARGIVCCTRRPLRLLECSVVTTIGGLVFLFRRCVFTLTPTAQR